MIESIKVHEYRKRLVEIWESVTPAVIDSESAAKVAQGRQYRTSTCADLAHFGYWELGLRHKQLNRAPNWAPGVNVSRLAYWPGVARPAPQGLEGVMGGDVLIRWQRPDTIDAHVVCVLAALPDGTIATAEYGQARPLIGRQFVREAVSLRGQRPWQRWLPLGAVLESCGITS